jgi:S1-C subfamily serine protease
MASRLTPVEFLSFSTVRIQAHLSNGLISTGKGFFYAIKQEDGGRHIPVIITNNHVVRDSTKGTFRLTLQKSDGSPDIGNHISVL